MSDHGNRTILVTGIGGDIGYSVLRCVRDGAMARTVIGTDMDIYACGRKLVDKFEQVPRGNYKDSYLLSLSGIVGKHSVTHILPTVEPEIETINESRDDYDALGAKLVMNVPNVVNVFSDKYETVQFLTDRRLSAPRTYLAEKYRKGTLPYPLIIKPRYGFGSWGYMKYWGFAVIHSDRELDWHTNSQKTGFVVQELIGDNDHEYTVGVFSDGRTVRSIAFRRYLGFGSMSKFVEIVQEKELDKIAQKVAVAIGLVGSINIQLRRRENGEFVPFEINPRLSSTVYFRHHWGFRDLEWWLDILDDNPLRYGAVSKRGVGVRTVEEVFFPARQE